MVSIGGLIEARGKDRAAELARLGEELAAADAVVIGAGSGLSTAAGFTYTGERFRRIFGDFIDRYGFADMYSGGFHPFGTLEEHWAYWSRYIWWNRYVPAPRGVYGELLELVGDRDYFVLTTNVDHQFQRAGFDKGRLFYTQGDYGLIQCCVPCHGETYDIEPLVRRMLEAQGYVEDGGGSYRMPEGAAPRMDVPAGLVPHCPRCGRPMAMNLRADGTFVQDDGWYRAASRWADFQRRHKGCRVLYVELGVGWNTPAIIKFPFWKAALENPRARYACVNMGEAVAPEELGRRAILIDGDIACAVRALGRAGRVGAGRAS